MGPYLLKVYNKDTRISYMDVVLMSFSLNSTMHLPNWYIFETVLQAERCSKPTTDNLAQLANLDKR